MFLSIQKCFNISYTCFCRLCQLVTSFGLNVKLSFIDQEQRSSSHVPRRVGKEDVPQELTWGNSEAGQNIRQQNVCLFVLLHSFSFPFTLLESIVPSPVAGDAAIEPHAPTAAPRTDRTVSQLLITYGGGFAPFPAVPVQVHLQAL